MLFNTYAFLLFFLPVTLAGWFALGRWAGPGPAKAWLVAASLFYYGWWNPWYLLLLGASTIANFLWGRGLARRAAAGLPTGAMLACGLIANLSVLGYYKYANFFVDNINAGFGAGWTLSKVILPLAISFFTFQKIAFLVDCSRGLARVDSFLDFALFVMFFPQLIAGPIVHHAEVMPQFARPEVVRPRWDNLSIGVTLFLFGLAKKVLLADPLSARVSDAFSAAAGGAPLPAAVAWYAVLAYTLQLYFDFSGYTDMALGLGRMFNILLPQNFNSPYQSANIIEFWRRWHMTLSRFLRDYLYFPLGGNRRGKLRRHVNLLTTMFLGGLWHGAGWTFVAWGVLHGACLVINHAWLEVKTRLVWLANVPREVRFLSSHALTLVIVIAAWVLFRSQNFPAAARMFQGLMGHTYAGEPDAITPPRPERWLWLALLGTMVLFAPNSQDVLSRFQPAIGIRDVSQHPGLLGGRLLWKPATTWAVFAAVVFAACFLSLSNVSEFLYYQF